MTSTPTLRPIDASEHLAFIARQDSVSFLQTPGWASVKSEWEHESLGWERDGELVGAGLVLYRRIPRSRRSLAYLPEGPAIDWAATDLRAWLDPLVEHVRRRGAFGVRVGPPAVVRAGSAQAVKDGLARGDLTRLGDLAPTRRDELGAVVVSQLRELGWRPPAESGGFAAGQPRFNFVVPLEGRNEDDVLAGMNQLWRRNIRKAAKAGVQVRIADTATLEEDLGAFHALYVHTAERDGFTPRPLAYFRRMFAALADPRTGGATLYLAHHEGDLVAATIAVRVGRHVWYSYGASSTEKRDVRGSNAVQWRMIQDALAAGARVYDLRGITDTLAPADPHVGLIQFKVGTGGEALEYAGEWDLPMNRLLYKAFDVYMSRRQGR